MKRFVDYYLREWKNSPYRKPLLLRGARQIGKTYAVRELGKIFENMVEINFELTEGAQGIFEKGDLEPERIIRDLFLLTRKRIIPGSTLLFFDEIQNTPKVLTALRYFYEKLPALHVIAAGSLLDFTIQSTGIPVGRVVSLYMYPLSFFEFLCACGYEILAQELVPGKFIVPLSEPVHHKLLSLFGEYCAIGGMPEAVMLWKDSGNPSLSFEVHHTLLDTYRQDFGKYADKFQIKYVSTLFDAIPRFLGTKFKYSAIEGEYRKRELSPCLDLLTTAGVVHSVVRSAGNGVPLGAEADLEDFKVIFLDSALAQAMLGLDLKAWFLQPEQEFVNKGSIIEATIGQEFLAYAHPSYKTKLFYWRRNTPGSEAEVDYLITHKGSVIPVEVKSGSGSTLRSMHMFLESHKDSPYGSRFSTQNYSVHEKIHSYPLYAVASVAKDLGHDIKAYEYVFTGHALKEKKQALKEAFMQANSDDDRLKIIKEWEALDGEDWHD
ncbi:MAG TPA: AAA family ATPase [Candidatus Babeliales bacterium]|nr:AAA family ATPase [Candidatus Babeliales bacterium]